MLDSNCDGTSGRAFREAEVLEIMLYMLMMISRCSTFLSPALCLPYMLDPITKMTNPNKL